MDSFILIFILIIVFVIFIFIMRILGIGKKTKCNACNNCCPDCRNPMERIRRLNIDYIINHLTFHMFNYKRYRCMNCGWEGLRWESSFKDKKKISND